MAFNKVILMGRLTAAPEIKVTPNGKEVCSFTVAVDRRFAKSGETKADFINCVAWDKTATFIGNYFGKGSPILVCGELQVRSWEDTNGNKRYATEVIASEVSFCGAKGEGEGNNTANNENGSKAQNNGSQGYVPDAYTAPQFEEIAADDDLPF